VKNGEIGGQQIGIVRDERGLDLVERPASSGELRRKSRECATVKLTQNGRDPEIPRRVEVLRLPVSLPQPTQPEADAGKQVDDAPERGKEKNWRQGFDAQLGAEAIQTHLGALHRKDSAIGPGSHPLTDEQDPPHRDRIAVGEEQYLLHALYR